MLVLSRKLGERIVIGDNITVKINRIHGNRVTLGIEAPDDVSILRGELEPIANSFRKTPCGKKVASAAAPMPAGEMLDPPGVSLDAIS